MWRISQFHIPGIDVISALGSIFGSAARAAVLVTLLSVSAACAPESTAIIVTATNDPTRVTGSDGMEHLEYDLIFTNAFYGPVTLTSIEVVTTDGRRLLRLKGEELKEIIQPLPGAGSMNEIPASGSAAVAIDVIIPPGEVPQQITHRITYEVSPNPLDTLISSKRIDGPVLTVSETQPIVIASPLRGTGWFNANGCCVASNHRSFRMIADGARYLKPETFAIDWIQARDNRLFKGDGTKNEQYFAYGADILSVAEGTVVSVRDGMEDTLPNQPPTTIKGPGDYSGNHVVVLIMPGVWASYAHLLPGSITVKEGDKVATGQLLGKLGSTGNSTAPHLHFGLGDGPDILTSNSLPFVIDGYTFVGTADVNTVEEAFLSGAPLGMEPGSPARTQSNTLPLNFAVTDFK
jgi:hypothetical protein